MRSACCCLSASSTTRFTSLKPQAEIFSLPLRYWPANVTFTLARFSFPGKGTLMPAFPVTQMIPLFIALGYLLMSDLDLLNRLAGLMLD